MTEMFWAGLDEFRAVADEVVERMSAAARDVVVEIASEVEKAAKENASGAPGPNVVTGTLRRGIRTTPVERWGVRGWRTTVGPTVIYSRRIDLGFYGADSIGRMYAQAPKPYFTPAWEDSMGRAERLYRAAITEAIAG